MTDFGYISHIDEMSNKNYIFSVNLYKIGLLVCVSNLQSTENVYCQPGRPSSGHKK